MLLSGGHFVLIGLVNTFVHVFMYTYYFVTNVWPEYTANRWWKKYMTQLQLVSFINKVRNTAFHFSLVSMHSNVLLNILKNPVDQGPS
jgi:hypothetical protein